MLWSTEEFGFVRLADAYATGSSMLPQKKNPDIAELARGKRRPGHRRPHRPARHAQGPAARVQPRPPGGQGAAVRRGRHLHAALPAVAGLLDTAEFVPERMQAAADDAASAATDLAELLVRQGVPFRDAHAVVGALVRQAVERGHRRSRSSSWPTRASARRRWRCSSRARRSGGARRPAAPARSRCAASSPPRAHRLDEQRAWLDGQ